MSKHSIHSFDITRFQFARDRVIGDSQVRTDEVNVAAIEIIDGENRRGLGFAQSLFQPLPDSEEILRVFRQEVWPLLEGQEPIALIHKIGRPRGGNQRSFSLPFGEALQVCLWDLAAKQISMPLYKLLGGGRNKVRAYASGLDYHLSDDEFARLFANADAQGYDTFKIKVGNTDFAWDLHRLDLVAKTVRKGASFMIDANEAWSAKEASVKLEEFRKLGHRILWVEDPILRNDFAGLRALCSALPWTMVNSGEYLDVSGKRELLLAGGTDILNVHGYITDNLHIGWLAAEMGVPVSQGNTFLEFGVHVACALPEVQWLEYSFQNFDHLVEQPIKVRDGWIEAPERPGHGLVLAERARREYAKPQLQAGQTPL